MACKLATVAVRSSVRAGMQNVVVVCSLLMGLHQQPWLVLDTHCCLPRTFVQRFDSFRLFSSALTFPANAVAAFLAGGVGKRKRKGEKKSRF